MDFVRYYSLPYSSFEKLCSQKWNSFKYKRSTYYLNATSSYFFVNTSFLFYFEIDSTILQAYIYIHKNMYGQ